MFITLLDAAGNLVNADALAVSVEWTASALFLPTIEYGAITYTTGDLYSTRDLAVHAAIECATIIASTPIPDLAADHPAGLSQLVEVK